MSGPVFFQPISLTAQLYVSSPSLLSPDSAIPFGHPSSFVSDVSTTSQDLHIQSVMYGDSIFHPSHTSVRYVQMSSKISSVTYALVPVLIYQVPAVSQPYIPPSHSIASLPYTIHYVPANSTTSTLVAQPGPSVSRLPSHPMQTRSKNRSH